MRQDTHKPLFDNSIQNVQKKCWDTWDSGKGGSKCFSFNTLGCPKDFGTVGQDLGTNGRFIILYLTRIARKSRCNSDLTLFRHPLSQVVLTGDIMRIRVLVLVVFLAAVSAVSAFAQPAPPATAQQDLTKYIRDNSTKREVMIPMRDGVKLFTAIYEPKAKTEKYPILMSRTPYSIAPYGKDSQGNDQFRRSLGPDELFAREGYIFVYQDVRGRWMSEGKFVEIRPETAQSKPGTTDESTDAYYTIDWLIKIFNNLQ